MSRLPPCDPADETVDEATAARLREASEGWHEDAAYFGVIAHQPTLLDRFAARFADLCEAFPDPALLELLLYASLEVGLDRFCIALRLDTTEESPTRRSSNTHGSRCPRHASDHGAGAPGVGPWADDRTEMCSVPSSL